MKTLHLPLKKEWYNMIESGVKTEEYREIKPYWINRLIQTEDGRIIKKGAAFVLDANRSFLYSGIYEGRLEYANYTHVRFSYGYTRRTMTFEIDSITVGNGKTEWGAPAHEIIFIIKLGKRV